MGRVGKRTGILSKIAETRRGDGGGCKRRCRRRAAAPTTHTREIRQRTWLTKRSPARAGYVRKLMGASQVSGRLSRFPPLLVDSLFSVCDGFPTYTEMDAKNGAAQLQVYIKSAAAHGFGTWYMSANHGHQKNKQGRGNRGHVSGNGSQKVRDNADTGEPVTIRPVGSACRNIW